MQNIGSAMLSYELSQDTFWLFSMHKCSYYVIGLKFKKEIIMFHILLPLQLGHE